ncbi:thioredoxin family protein [Levilactobacillus lindianensis]|uniref:thioredoxin family protein n=1 Tax=Levilactobacillus lindianensis TaxID=2486018 RepID=UPI000F744999|nr:thioredoxin family protein [Levilactobacillus lindianensis]
MIKEIHDQDFEKETNTGVTVVDFRADWCPPCKMMDPILQKLSESEDFKDQVTFTSINIDHDKQIASQFQVQGIPTFLIKKDGQVINRLVGARPKPLFEAALKEALA